MLAGSLYPRPIRAYLAGVLVNFALQLASIVPNRRCRIKMAATLYLGGIIASCAVSLFLLPANFIPTSVLLYSFYATAVVQAGFLVDRRAPVVLAGVSVLMICVHMQLNVQVYNTLPTFGTFSLFTIVAFVMVMMVTLALLTWVTAGDLEFALAQADRTGEVEKLFQELKDSNAELLEMKTELEEANRHLEAQAAIDSMTGLSNHRVFQQTLRSQVALANRHGQPLSLVMLDVDRFKMYNDRFGHPAGDTVLKTLGAIIRETVRVSDLPARYGGEEFAIILPQTTIPAAIEAAERIRSAVAEHRFPHTRMTVSIGVAELHVHAEDADGLVRVADGALYLAKHSGRNCVAVAPTPDGPAMALAHDTAGPQTAAEDTLGRPVIRTTASTVSGSFGGIAAILDGPSAPVIAALLAALELRQVETPEHPQRVARYAVRLARALAERRGTLDKLPHTELHSLAMGALLHDIGTLRLPDEILRKQGPLTEAEWIIVRGHPIIGADVVSEVPLVAGALPVVRHHHERWDGQGYPDRLRGDAIPLGARIFAVCDMLDSITTERPYRKAQSYAAAREEIRRMAGAQFDPEVVDAFLSVPDAEWEHLAQPVLEHDERLAA